MSALDAARRPSRELPRIEPMPLVLAIEPDPRQASRLEHLMRTRVGAELIRADTTADALAAIGTRVPDLVLVPSLLSPQEDAALAGALRVIAAAARVQMLTIPLLADPEQPPDARRGLLGRWRRGAARQTAGCDPALFAEQVAAYLAHARSDRLDGADEPRDLDAPAARGTAHAADTRAGAEPARRDATITTPSPSDEPTLLIEPRRLVAPAAFVKHVRETAILTTPPAHRIDLDQASRPVGSSSADVVASSREQVEEARNEEETIAAIDDIAQRARGDHAAAERAEAAAASLVASHDRDGHEARHERTKGRSGATVDDDDGRAHQVPASALDARMPLRVTHDAERESVAELADRTRVLQGLDAPSEQGSSHAAETNSTDAAEVKSPHAEAGDLGSVARGAGDDTGTLGTIDTAAQATRGTQTESERVAALAHVLLGRDREDHEEPCEESDERQGGPAAAIASDAGEMSHAPMLPDIDSTPTGREHLLLAHNSGQPGDAAAPDRAVVDEPPETRAALASSAAGTSASRQGEHVDVDAGATTRLVVRADRDGRDAGERHNEEIGGAVANQLASGGERQEDPGPRPRGGSAEDEIDASTVDALIAPLLRELMASRRARTESRATERPASGPKSGDRREQAACLQHSDDDGFATLHIASRKEEQTTAQGQILNQDPAPDSDRDGSRDFEAAHEYLQAHSHAQAQAEKRVRANAHERTQRPPLATLRERARPRTHAGAPEREGSGQLGAASTSDAAQMGHGAAEPAAESSPACSDGEGRVWHRPTPVRDGDHVSAGWQERGQGAEAQPLLAGRADEAINVQAHQIEHVQTEDVCSVEASSSAWSAVASPDEIDPMFFVDEDSPDAGPPTSGAASVHAAASPPLALEAPDAAPASSGPPAAGAPAAAREPWVELIESLRQDIERLRLEREAAGSQADRTRPTSRVVTSFDEAKSRVRPRVTVPQLRMPDPARPNARPTRKRPVQDQWGLFDPEQCGFAALLAKLDEISARDEASA